jgi:thiamine-phosphate pyrophosphorylase
MLHVISNPRPVANEASLINQLFDEGLRVFHLRKPESSLEEMTLLLHGINPCHYQKIALHQHHSLADDFGMNRLHYTEAARKAASQETLAKQRAEYILSTSVHSLTDYQSLAEYFDYAFLGPVFNSISKPGYQAQSFALKKSDKKIYTNLIALGGIDEHNYHQAYDMGYDGIALLGAVWNKEDKLSTFKTIQSKCLTNGR